MCCQCQVHNLVWTSTRILKFGLSPSIISPQTHRWTEKHKREMQFWVTTDHKIDLTNFETLQSELLWANVNTGLTQLQLAS